jgi:hypothetical protein
VADVVVAEAVPDTVEQVVVTVPGAFAQLHTAFAASNTDISSAEEQDANAHGVTSAVSEE